MPDHFVGTELAPMVALAFAAAATDTLRVGMLVLGNDYKHPAVTAKEAATLDLLSGGRLEFGLGAGWMTRRLRARSAFPTTRPHVRIERLAKRSRSSGGAGTRARSASTASTTRSATTTRCPSRSQQQPPILVGGGGRQMLRLAGRVADVVGINPNLRAGEVGADAAHEHARGRDPGEDRLGP